MSSTVVAAATAALAIPTALKVNGLEVSSVPAEFMSPYNGSLAPGVIPVDTPVPNFGAALTDSIIQYLKDKKYDLYEPGKKRHTAGRGISEEMHIDCHKILISENFVSMYVLSNNVTTGSTDGSNLNYSISTWEDKSLRTSQMITVVGSRDAVTGTVKSVGVPDTSKNASMTIKNDSPNPWYCKMGGPKLPNLDWQSIAPAVVNDTSTALSITPTLTNDGVNVLGVAAEFLQAYKGPYAKGVCALAKPNTKFGAVLAESITKILTRLGYFLYAPGNKRQTTQSIVNEQQAVDCKKVFVSDNHVVMFTLWNKVTARASTNEYSINKWGDGVPQVITGIS